MVFNLDTRRYLARAPKSALRWHERLFGMIGRRFDVSCDAMVFPHCHAVHTFFMGIVLDLVFLDAEGTVVHLVPSAGRFRPWFGCRRAATVIELPEGRIAASGTEVGHRINLNMNLTAEAIAKLRCGGILWDDGL